jgi:hypothetical protein
MDTSAGLSLNNPMADKVVMDVAELRETETLLWPFLMSLAVLVVFAIIRNRFPERIGRVLAIEFYNGQMLQMLRDEPPLSSGSGFLLKSLLVYALGMLTFSALPVFAPHIEPNLPVFGIILGAFGVTIFFRTMVQRIVAFLAGTDNGLYQTQLVQDVNAYFMALVLLPPAIAIPLLPIPDEFLTPIMIGVGIVFCFLYLYGMYRGILVSLRAGVHWLYIILYLCTLEILPFVVLIAVLVNAEL